MDNRSYIIPVSNKNMVEEKIEKLNRRANRLDLQPITITWGKPFVNEKGNLLVDCSISGPLSVSFDGWQFVATLQHLPTGENILRSVSDEFVIPLEYRSSGSACEHCKVNRYRKDTYVVHKNGQYVQVGSSCMKDFLGNSPDNILARAQWISELNSFMSGAAGISSDENIYHIHMFLANASAIIKQYGWLSKSKAYENGGTPTATRILTNLEASLGEHISTSDRDMQLAKEAAEWAENISDEDAEISDYLYNIRAIARAGMVGHRTAGYAASIIGAYDRELTKRKPIMPSNHIGSIKERKSFNLTLKKTFSGASNYGVYYKYIFQDKDCNVFIWTTSSNQELEEGTTYLLVGTIKAHSEFKSVKQNEITRCKIEMVYGEENVS